MDYKDILLMRAREAMQYTADTLEGILRADDDATIAAEFVGEINGDEVMQNEDTIDWQKQRERNSELQVMLNAATQISRLSVNRDSDEALAFLMHINKEWTSTTPAERSSMCREQFGDPETLHLDIGLRHSPSAELILAKHDRWTRDRLYADREIIQLVEEMRRQIETLRGANVKPKEVTPMTIQDDAFEHISKVCGKPKTLIAKVFKALDWDDARVQDTELDGVTIGERSVGPRARREQLIHENLTPEPKYPPSAVERQQRAQKRRDRRPIELTDLERAFMLAQRDDRERMTKTIYAMFLNMRAEISRMNQQQSLKAARKAHLAQQIERTKAEYERLSAA